EELDQPVVAASAPERGLGADALVVRLERRAPVVVEAADDAGVDAVGDAPGVEVAPHLLEVGARRLAQPVERAVEVGDEGLVAGVLAVEDAHGVEAQPLAADLRELVASGLQ